MKKLLSALLALCVLLSFAGCTGNTTTPTDAATNAPTDAPTDAPTNSTAQSLPELSDTITAGAAVDFVTMQQPIDVTDASETGLSSLKYFTGLDSNQGLKDALATEAAIGSIPFSLVLVQVEDAANAKTVAEAMKKGIDQRKWVCVEADDLQVAGCGDVVMLVMIGSDYEISTDVFVDTFRTACGEPDFVLK